jgi:hypothetical protein
VVATGLSKKTLASAATPIVQVKRGPVSVEGLSEEDYDIPTIMRGNKNEQKAKNVMGSDTNTMDPAYLDIPAFLRRQAD